MTDFVGDILIPKTDGATVVHVPHVCIIESPAPLDLLDKRREGLALSEALSLAKIRNEYYAVTDIPTLMLAFDRIASFAAITRLGPSDNREGEYIGFPRLYLHFSCHGSEEGIQLTSGEVVEWKGLGAQLLTLGVQMKIFQPDAVPVIPMLQVGITMSACSGLFAKAMATDKFCPFAFLVGSSKPVTWSDSLTAFITFYHHIAHKGRTLRPSVKAMNGAAMLRDAFEAVDAADVGVDGISRSTIVIAMMMNSEGRISYVFDTEKGHSGKPLTAERDHFVDELGKPVPYFDTPEGALEFMSKNRKYRCQVEYGAATDLMIMNSQGELSY